MKDKIVLIGLFLGLTSIIFGAFGAHALKSILTESQLQSFEVGVRYQMYHALFLLFIGKYSGIPEVAQKYIAWGIILGVVLFSGSIYLLALSPIIGIDFSFLGPVTPIGGFLLIGSWFLLFLNFFKQKG